MTEDEAQKHNISKEDYLKLFLDAKKIEEKLIMSYATLEKQIRSLPEECLDEVSNYIDFILFRMKMKNDDSIIQDNSIFFGVLENIPDGMDLQRSMRDEWD